MENHQEMEQDIVQVVQPPYSLNVIDFDNQKILIRSDQTKSFKGKNVVIDDNSASRMIKQKKSKSRSAKSRSKKEKISFKTKAD
jgi:hypothetical protein